MVKGISSKKAQELEERQAAWEKEYYHKENMWQEDLSDAIASGDLPKLEDAFGRGWDVNQPLLRYYAEPCRTTCNWEDEMRIVHFPVMWAIRNNCFESVEWLVSHGARLDMEEPVGKYNDAIFHAVEAALQKDVVPEMLRFVVSKGAKLRGKKFYKYIFWPIRYRARRIDMLPLLVELGADIESAMGVVVSAAAYNEIEMLEAFFAVGFDINWHTGKGNNYLKDTVLGHAALYGTPKTVRYLLSRGADPTIRNAKGMTPYDLALQNHKLENAAILRDLCDPDGEGRRQAKEKLPQDIRDYLKDGGRRLTLGRDDIDYIDFLALDDVTLLSLARRKCVLLSKEVENYPTLWIVWNTTRKTVAYYDYENEWYGEFKVSFTRFLAGIDQYLTGIFHGDYEM